MAGHGGRQLNVAIVGCGLIGQKRAKALAGAPLVVCVEAIRRAPSNWRAVQPGASPYADWRQAVERDDVSMVVVATPHVALAEITGGAIRQASTSWWKSRRRSMSANCGHCRNPRPSRAFWCMSVSTTDTTGRSSKPERSSTPAPLGPLMFVRARYGHGGRVGYDKEWRARPELSGGGELIDQGVHIIDLARWFLGDFVDGGRVCRRPTSGTCRSTTMRFLLLKTRQQAGCVPARQLHRVEEHFSRSRSTGENGKLQIDGLGGSYGVERLACYKMLPEMGPPETTIWEYPMGDDSWEVEMAEFMEDIRLGREPAAGLEGRAARHWRSSNKIYTGSGHDHHA